MIKNIVFDVGKVLVSYEPEQYLKKIGYDEEICAQVMKAVFNSQLWIENDRGSLSIKELEDSFVANAPRYESYIREVFRNAGGTIDLLPHTMKWVKDLKARGYHLYIISNYGEYLYQQTEHKMQFLPYMDGVIFSYRHKMIKPEKAIYEKLLSEFHLNPEECVFIDDCLKNVEAAKKVGLYGIQFKNFEQANDELEKLLH